MWPRSVRFPSEAQKAVGCGQGNSFPVAPLVRERLWGVGTSSRDCHEVSHIVSRDWIELHISFVGASMCLLLYVQVHVVDGNALVCPTVQRVEDNFSCHSSDTIYFDFFETVSHWFGTCQVGWDSRSGGPQDLTVSVSPVLGPSIHHYSWLCYYYVCVCEFWSIELRSSQWRGKRFTNWAICPSWGFLSSSLCSILLAPG